MRIYLIPAMLFAVIVSAKAATTNEYILCPEVMNEDGAYVQYTAPTAKIESTPAWNGTGEPPLSISKALNLTEAYLNGKYSTRRQHRPLHITLQRLWSSEKDDRYFWFYTLFFTPELIVFPKSTDAHEFREFVVMLMDGTIIEPKAIKKTSEHISYRERLEKRRQELEQTTDVQPKPDGDPSKSVP